MVLLLLLIFSASCADMLWPWSELWKNKNKGGTAAADSETYSPTTPAIEGTTRYAIALGGVAPGRDELIITGDAGETINFGGSELSFSVDNDVIGLLPRPGYGDFASGSGAQIIPQKVGQSVVSYSVDGIEEEDQFLVIVPPQSLIQMMVSEASTQLTDEATVGGDYHVELTSSSATGNAIGYVTRNRVDIIGETEIHSLFGVDENDWDSNPTASYYDSVITAVSGGVYQYSPVDPSNPAHETYENAEARGFLDSSYHRAYDQAVLTSAGVFAGTISDPTGTAFGFFSPTSDQWEEIELAYQFALFDLTNGCGFTDSDFSELAPIQILVLPAVWTYEDGRPAFVFIRSKGPLEYAVVKTP